ncbi:MAG: hypothetical protein QOI13_3039 [Paraburkholderia sp.]|nr:hypothetical protein [Paraburkholderia sp.]
MRRFGWGGAVAAVVLTAGCAGVAGFGAPPLAALQAQCGAQADYGADAPAVYSALLDAYVAYRHARIDKAGYCAFQASISRQHAALLSGGPRARPAWAAFFNDARVKAIDWRAAIDPSLRGG